MMRRALYPVLTVFLSVLFLCLQSGAQLHSLQASDNSNHKDCVVCTASANAEVNIVVPEPVLRGVPLVKSASVTEFETHHESRDYRTPPGRAPPPRSPPLTHI